jgi:hypothetical protein
MSKFQIQLNRKNIPEEELLLDLKMVSEKLAKNSITVLEYNSTGTFGSNTILRKFGSWNDALVKAGLEAPNRQNIPDAELYENIVTVWTSLGRQPFGREMEKRNGLSTISLGTYEKRFGSWNNSLLAFDKYLNSDEAKDVLVDEPESPEPSGTTKSQSGTTRHKTKREISDRMRFRILMRDGFSCQSCGKSPTTERGVELHVDHILPWSKGGETVEDNLQTKCSKCNLGKGNAFTV